MLRTKAADGINKNGGRRSDNNGGDPDVRSLVDLVNMLHTSENPLWDLVRFEARVHMLSGVPTPARKTHRRPLFVFFSGAHHNKKLK